MKSESDLDMISYILGFNKGVRDKTGAVEIEGGITCTDDGNGNITIEEEGD